MLRIIHLFFVQPLLALLLVVSLLLVPARLTAEDDFIAANIGVRTEDPGPFLLWPLEQTNITAVTRLPDSLWTHEFLGIKDCPPYPALLDAGRWKNYVPAGNYPGNRNVVKDGMPDSRVKWQNAGDPSLMGNAIACYGARTQAPTLPLHAGTDISEGNGVSVHAAAAADQVNVHYGDGQYRVRLRHPNVNGSGQTWYTFYVHLSSAAWSEGTHNITLAAGAEVGKVGSGHLHFQPAVGPNYNESEARNPWGIDSSPWGGCLWLDRSICQVVETPPAESPSITAPSAGHFSDVPQTMPFYPYIEALYRIGAVQGTGGGSTRLFKPTDYTERDQAAKMIDLGLLRKPNYQDNQYAFNDVGPGHAFYQYIRDLKELGIVQGYQGGAYFNDPNKPPPDNVRITRCQAATLIIRARREDPGYTDNRQTYPDVSRSHACYNAIERLVEIGASPYPKGMRFYPDYPVTRELMAYIVVRGLPDLSANITTFVDVNFDHPYFGYIESIYARGITKGCDSSVQPPYLKYCPDMLLNREQAAAFVERSLGFTPYYSDGRESFSDVAPSDTFYHTIEHLHEIGVVQGYSDGTFRPKALITRRQFAQLVQRALGVAKITCPAAHTAPFSDVPPDSDGYEAIQCLKDLQISSGYSSGEFMPDANINRAQAAKLMDLAFVRKIVDVPQEPSEAVNDSAGTAPIFEPLPPEPESVPDNVGAAEGIALVTPNGPSDQDVDLISMDLVADTPYVFIATEMGANADVNLQISKINGMQGADAVEELVYTAAFDDLSAGRASFTAAATGRYLLRFTNNKPFATEGVNYRIAVREKAASPPPPSGAYSLYLPAIEKR